eukprot:14268360-Alexandrium_andersonii.AAC.1
MPQDPRLHAHVFALCTSGAHRWHALGTKCASATAHRAAVAHGTSRELRFRNSACSRRRCVCS